MPRKPEPPRLYIRKRQGRPPVWVLRDGAKEVSSGIGADRRDDAIEWFRDYYRKNPKLDTSERNLANVICGDVLTLYARDLPADSPTRKTIAYHIKALSPFWGEKTLADVKGSTCRAYISDRTMKTTTTQLHSHLRSGKKSVATSTARQELKTFQAAINHWHQESPLEAVPKVTLPKAGERRERVLERSEVARMLWACRKLKLPHVARFILIGLYTGTRHDAILALRRMPSSHGGHYDPVRGVLYRRGATERETSKRRPPVSVSPRLGAFLSRWLRQDVEVQTQHLVHYNGTRILKMKRAWKSVVKAAGLGPDVTPHTLRHTCASWLLWQGKTIWDVAGIIGADASTVERVYGHHRRVE